MQASFEQLMDQFVQAGTVEWIGTRPEKRAEVVTVNSAMLDPAYGIQGDHYAGQSGKRQVTLIQAEHLPAIASMLHCDLVKPEQLRRNVVVSGINLLALKDKSFQLGEAVLKFTGLCHPCSRMEENLGVGGYNAMRGHGGITARVISPGKVQVGDKCGVVFNWL
ncbi:MAG: MOSC domain-containing protein [Gammaproteobacteria bacterium]|jgi:MOSC domain-containing protein YiiM